MAASRLFADEAPASVNAWMNSQGYRTTLGNPWRTEALINTLSHPQLAGLDKDGKPVEGAEAIFSVEERSKLLALFAGYKKPVTEERSDPHDYLLNDEAASCDRCSHAMIANRVKAGGPPQYRCPAPGPNGTSCGGVSITAERLEGPVTEQVLAELLRPKAQERIAALLHDIQEELARLQTFVKGAEAEKVRLRELRREKVLSVVAHEAAQKALQKQVKDAQTRMAFLDQMVVSVPSGGVDDLIAWWEAAPITSRRALVRLETETIRVLPGRRGRGSDPYDRIDIVWRQPSKTARAAKSRVAKGAGSKAA
ncbi:recombinase zinc beta ribbon domain-containing protein [Streptomyces syringium]|uniref:zinc ribbon domain-containing protein n=1 Tax=Streptomyces syringium TaxID=76729 RepID=UPI003D8A8CC1